jgi:electron transfer flavoprotein alpha subunit
MGGGDGAAPGIWALGEVAEGRATRLTLELATLAARLAASSGGRAATLLAGAGAADAAAEVAAHGTDVLVLDVGPAGDEAAGAARAATPDPATLAPALAALMEERDPAVLLAGTTPTGRDVAGMLVGLTDRAVLVAASAVAWTEDGPEAEASVFGGRLVTRSVLEGGRGIVLVRPASVAAERAATPGAVETLVLPPARALPAPRLVEQVAQAGAAASIEEARVIVGAGRGVGGPDGLTLVEELAEALGGVVGGTRAVVDSGWMAYARQIGQTGRTVKPDLYVACGVSGAIQHKVGVQTAGTIVAINRDPDAPIAEFADLLVVGDLFEVVPRLAAAVRARRSATG